MMESAEFFQRIEEHFKSSLPCVVYRKPYQNEVNVLLQKNKKIYFTEDYTESGFVFAPFDDKQNSILIPISHSETYVSIPNQNIKIDNSTSEINHDQRNKLHHIELVKKGIISIKEGIFQKVVLSRREKLILKEEDPITLFIRLLNFYASAFVYCWYHPKIGLWLGATPETLLRVEGNRFETMALAGTQEYKGTVMVDWGNKEKDEQNIVTNFVVEALKKKVTSLSILPTETIKAGNVLHLLSKIKGTLNFDKFNLKEIIYGLHPTPAICGIPKEITKDFILKNENYKREFYTGFLGELNYQNKSELFVNLRCMQLKNNQAILYVGGGITKDSDPESEWIETVNKTNTIKKVLT